MKTHKWDYETHNYKDWQVPDGAAMYVDDLTQNIKCASCGRELPAGDCYCSMIIHDPLGFGWLVCNACYEKEVNERREWDKKNIERK